MEKEKSEIENRVMDGIPLVGSKVDITGLGRVYCSKDQNGTLVFLGRNSDGEIARHCVDKDKINSLGGCSYEFKQIRETELFEHCDGNYHRLDKELRSAKL